jgi:hypothetical protein
LNRELSKKAKISEKVYLDDEHNVVDKSKATCFFVTEYDENGWPIGERFGLVIAKSNSLPSFVLFYGL